MNSKGKILAAGLVLALLLAACSGASPAPAAAPKPASVPPSSASSSAPAVASSAPQPQQVLQGYLNLTFDSPDGFVAADETNSLFTRADAADDASSITVVYAEKSATDEAFGAKEDYEASLEEVYRPLYGDDTACTIDEFEEIEVSGYSALYYTAAIVGKAVDWQQVTVLVETEGGFFTVTYTDASQDTRWIEAFKTSARGVRLAEEAV